MFIIDTQYMNECFKRALMDGSHTIHQKPDTVRKYLLETYECELDCSHVVTNSGDVFEIKTSYDESYITLIPA